MSLKTFSEVSRELNEFFDIPTDERNLCVNTKKRFSNPELLSTAHFQKTRD